MRTAKTRGVSKDIKVLDHFTLLWKWVCARNYYKKAVGGTMPAFSFERG